MNNHIIEVAKYAAYKSNFRFRLGAVIFNHGRILGVGWNNPYKTHPKSNTPYRTIHAEFAAALDCEKGKIRGSNIYVHRLLRNGNPALAKPCKHCLAMLKGYGLQNIFFSTLNGVVRLHDSCL
jgi:deoxycytidylate deaminase